MTDIKLPRAVVLLSGGMDSTVLLAHSKALYYDVEALTINYGQRHMKEIEAARLVALHYGVPHQILDIPDIVLASPTSSQTNDAIEVPEGHYAAENMKKTVVPNRNMLLLSVAIAHAIKRGARYVAYAAHAGDHAIYPDCRPEFVSAMQDAARLCDWNPVSILTPFIKWTKAEIVEWGLKNNVPFEKTWTCYNGRRNSCGRCGTCVERLEAFSLNAANDPLSYEDPSFWISAVHR